MGAERQANKRQQSGTGLARAQRKEGAPHLANYRNRHSKAEP